ncbi:MAG: hypothetical protein AABY22_21400 [Nanoarchaeota archaeon]
MERDPLPKSAFPQEEYKNYFSLFHNKPVILSSIETPNLRKAVERLLEVGLVIGMEVKKIDGSKDMIVRWKQVEK